MERWLISFQTVRTPRQAWLGKISLLDNFVWTPSTHPTSHPSPTTHKTWLEQYFDTNILEKGKGLKTRALGFRPFPGLGQKKTKKLEIACVGSSDELFGIRLHHPTQFVILFFVVITVFCQTPGFAKLWGWEMFKTMQIFLHIFRALFLRPLPFSRGRLGLVGRIDT